MRIAMSVLRGWLIVLGVVTTSVLVAPAAHAHGDQGLVVVSGLEQSGDQFRRPLLVIRPDGTIVRQVTHPAWGETDSAASWSPDASRIVFEHDDADGYPNVATVRADGTGLVQLTDCSIDSDPCSNGTPAWTPDGKTIVFEHCCVAGNGGYLDGLYTMRRDGSHIRRLTLNPDLNWGDGVPTVSPDGRWIAFSRFIGAADDPLNQNVSALFLIRSDGTGLHRVSSYDLMVDEKDWSPDGRRIVFTSHAGSNTGPFRADVFTIRPDGGDLRQLTHTTTGADLAFFPTWSPDGRRIMFNYSPSADCASLYTMRADGSDVRPVTHPLCGALWPDWARRPMH